MRMIDELDGQITNLWKFWSIRLNAVAGACSTGVMTYEGFKTADPALVRWIPLWIICMLAAGAVLFIVAAMLARAAKQPTQCPDNGPH